MKFIKSYAETLTLELSEIQELTLQFEKLKMTLEFEKL